MESIVITDFGVSLGKTSERIVVRGHRPRLELIEGGPQLLLPVDLPLSASPTLKVVTSDGVRQPPSDERKRKPKSDQAWKPPQIELPFFRVSEIVIASPGVSLSTDLIEACCERGIRISFLTPGGRPYAMISSPMLTATVITRREQLAAYLDRRGLEISKTIVKGKLNNQANLLKYFGKYLKTTGQATYRQLRDKIDSLETAREEVDRVEGSRIDDARPALMAIEGGSGRLYWNGVKALLAERVAFESREHRGATDEVNSALNYGYGILYTQVWGAIMNAGLEPFAGFLHVDRPGKPSLVLDLIEEFRQPIVDRSVIAYINKGSKIEVRDGLLTEESRQAIASAVLERLESEAMFKGKRYRLKSIIQIQARSLASFLRGEGPYKSFSWKW